MEEGLNMTLKAAPTYKGVDSIPPHEINTMTAPVELDVAGVFAQLDRSPYIKMIMGIICNEIFIRPPQFLLAGHVLEPTPFFQGIFNRWYLPAARAAYKWLITVGFVPISFMITHNGRVVPVVLDSSTCRVMVYHSFNIEGVGYIVSRVDPVTGSAINSHSLYDSYRKTTHPKIIRDPRENEARRLDMASSFMSGLDPFDGNIVVFDVAAFRPSPSGVIQTPVMDCIRVQLEYESHEMIRMANYRQISNHKPLVTIPETPPDKFVQQMLAEARGAGQQAVVARAKEVFAETLNLVHGANQKTHIESAQQISKVANEAYQSPYFQQLMAETNNAAYIPIVGASGISSFVPPQIAMPTNIDARIELQKDFSRIFRIPTSVIFPQTTTKGNLAFNDIQFRGVVSEGAGLVETFLNTLFTSLEQQHNLDFSFSFFFDKYIRASILERIARGTSRFYMMEAASIVNPKMVNELVDELAVLKLKHPQTVFTLNNSMAKKRIQWVPLTESVDNNRPYFDYDNDSDRLVMYPDRQKMNNQTWLQQREKFHRAVLSNSANQAENGVRVTITKGNSNGEKSKTTTTTASETDDANGLNISSSLALATSSEIDDIYLYALFTSEKQHLYDVAHAAFVKEDIDKVRATLNAGLKKSTEQLIEIKIVSIGAVSTEDLIYFAALGFISPKEAIEQIQARCSIGQSSSVGTDQMQIFEQIKAFLATKKMTEILARGGLTWVTQIPEMIKSINSNELDDFYEKKSTKSKTAAGPSKSGGQSKKPGGGGGGGTNTSGGLSSESHSESHEQKRIKTTESKIRSTSAIGRGQAKGTNKPKTKRARLDSGEEDKRERNAKRPRTNVEDVAS